MKLEIGTKLHGFAVRGIQKIPELRATMYRMEYEKNGADLVWLSRPDDNKTFAIAFKTIPQDDTGVFHILEHSVLCGSAKYPVREPFVELLKSSLQTFLNAMTFPDKTMYPLSSRNDKDFLNLVDVYMDAVLHPLSISSPLAFRQEGWHYELDSPDGELGVNGVVYNEMKGAFSAPDEVLSYELGRQLFPENCYGCCSGGHPEHIPELTYESYLHNHARFYHPSNSRIFLDGEMDIDAVLEKLDTFLAEYERIDPDADIPMQSAVDAGEVTARYEIGAEEDPADKVIIGEGWVYGTYADQERTIAASVLAEALCGTNESPVKKALLERGLAQDVSIASYDGIQQNYMVLDIRNTSEEKRAEAVNTVREVLRQQADGGLDRSRLHAILNHMEFANREKDYGRMPRGLVFAMISMESWLYGGDPAQNLSYDETFRSLRAKIDEGYFEKLIVQMLLENPHHARVVLLPSRTLGAEKAEALRRELDEVKNGWNAEKIDGVMREFAELRRHQSEGDTPEGIATLPKLSLEDIPERSAPVKTRVVTMDGTDVLHQDIETGGITYLDVYFKVGDLDMDTLAALPILTELLGELSTDAHSALELTSLIREKLGRFSVDAQCYGKGDMCIPAVCVSVAILEERKAETLELLREILYTTNIKDSSAVYNILRQGRMGMEQTVAASGNAFAALRARAGLGAYGAVSDTLGGISQLRFLQDSEKNYGDGSALTAKLEEIYKKIFTRERAVLSVTGAMDEGWLRDVLALLPSGEVGKSAHYEAEEHGAEGFAIPAGIGYAARCGDLGAVGASYCGSMLVASKILSLDYLWNAVRVKGGAYGVNMGVDVHGTVNFTSFRDPRCGGTIDTFNAAGEALRAFCASGEDADRYIISTIGDLEPLMTPRQEKARAANMYFIGYDDEYRQRVRSEVLHTTREQLEEFAAVLDELRKSSRTCVIGGQPILDACGDKLDTTVPLQ